MAITRDMTELKLLEKEVQKLEMQNENFKKLQAIHNKESNLIGFTCHGPSSEACYENRRGRFYRLISGESGVGKEEITSSSIHLVDEAISNY